MISSRPAHMSRIMTPFGERAERIERAERPGEAEPWADVSEGRRRCADRIEGRHVEPGARRLDRQDQRAGHEEADVDHAEREDRPECPLVDDAAVEPDRQDGLAVDGLVELAPQDLRDQRCAGRP